MRRANVVSGIVLAAFSLVMLFAVIPWQIEPGPQGMMSPRLVPSMMMIFIAVLSAMLIIGNLRPAEGAVADEPAMPFSRSEVAALVKLGAVFALALGLYLFVSPLAAGAGLMVGSLLALGERRPLVIVAMPAAFLLAIWLLFYKVLGTAIV